MADLVQIYFERDLTEAEAKALEKLLRDSVDAADRFADQAEKYYASTGLPAHQWPGKPIAIPHIGGLGTGLKILLAVAIGGTGAVAWHLMHLTPIAPIVTTPVPKVIAPVKPMVPKKVHPKKAKELEGEKLSVLVETQRSSLVTVRILDHKGKEVRALYAGVLDAGQWVFHWDGLLADGKRASVGQYRIQVENGPHVLSKVVRIEAK